MVSFLFFVASSLRSLIQGAVWMDRVVWPGVPLRSQTQMDKMRGKRRHSWGLAAPCIIRPGINERGALHWWHWLYCHSVIRLSAHQELRGRDSLNAVASRLKLLCSSNGECLRSSAESICGSVNDGTISWGHKWPALLAAGKIKLVSKHVLMMRMFRFSCVYYCKCVFHLLEQNCLGSIMWK